MGMGWVQKRSSAFVVVVFRLAMLSAVTSDAEEAPVGAASAASGGVPSPSSAGVAGLRQLPRKLLLNASIGGEHYAPARTGLNDCSTEDVTVYQNGANPLPSGIPTFVVKITNVCEDCRVSNVHVACAEFASTELIDPAVFQRVAVNDCVVKGGGAIEPGEIISFTYANSFPYELKVASVGCE